MCLHVPGLRLVMAASLAAADPGAPAEDSSDSEPEPEPQKLSRKVSTSGQIKRKVRRGRLGQERGVGAASGRGHE